MTKLFFRFVENLLKTTMLLGVLLTFTGCDALYDAINTPPGNDSSGASHGYYGGNYTNQGDSDRNGTFTMELEQNSSGAISGVARYTKATGYDSGLLSVVGNLNGGNGHVQFLNQRGNSVAKGIISPNQGNYTFLQDGGRSDWVPFESLLWRN